MFQTIIEPLASFIIWLISTLGYPGVVLAMAIESACIPLPSEIIMPFSGFLVSKGVFTFWLTTLAGAFGCLLGSATAFLVGKYGGEDLVRFLIKKYGKFFLVFEYELDEAQEWFRKHGEVIAFTSRLLPVIRTFISLPAGISEMNFAKFCFFTFTGSFIWSAALVYLGLVLGENWRSIGSWFHKFDILIVIFGIAAFVWYVRHKLIKHQNYLKNKTPKS